MKKLLTILAIVFMTSTAWAATNVSFKWDANSESDLAGYKIYQSATSGNYTGVTPVDIPLASLADPTNPEFTKMSIPDGTWFWVATAYDTTGNESGYSNEITSTLDTAPPAPPENFSIWQKIIAWLKHFFNWG